LIIRFSSIGDIVLTSPIVRCVYNQYSKNIHILTKSNFRSLYDNSPYVSKVICYDDYPLLDLVKILRKENYQLILDLHKNLKSKIISFLLFKKVISFSKLNLKKWLYVKLKLNLLPSLHLVDRYFDSLNELKIINDKQGLNYFYKSDFQPSTESFINTNYAVAVLGAAHYTKTVPKEKWQQWISKIDLPIILIGGKAEIPLSIELSKMQNTINKVGICSLDESAYYLEKSSFVISPDTGMMHIAASFQKSIISVWGNTLPQFGMYPYYANNQIKNINLEVSNLKCRPCSKIGYNKCPQNHHNCMNLQVNDLNQFITKITAES
jgi:ADP-heptose:LPS heptosyltransferase